jgi:hypothetical protein
MRADGEEQKNEQDVQREAMKDGHRTPCEIRPRRQAQILADQPSAIRTDGRQKLRIQSL